MLHRFSKFLVACTVLLILAGSLVTSHDAGLSVPDWPTSYGWNMFTFPPSMWVANILYEHGHRLIASGVGFLAIIMAVWLWIAEPRRWLRWFGVATLGSVVAQGLLGGLTVLFFLPAAISTAHAGLAEIFFCMTVAIAIFTSPGWIAGYGVGADPPLRYLATTATILIYAQILIGATMRHTGAGLAIPDFPWMFGHVVPDHWSAAIAIHFTHRVGALVVTLTILTLFAHVRSRYRERRELMRPAALLVALVAAQVTLGALTVLSRRDPWTNSVHVVCGAMVLATALVVTLRAWQSRIADCGLRIADWIADSPAADFAAADSPAADSPAADSAAADSAAADSPAANSPAADSPAADSPTADSPAADSPAADSPAADSPAASLIHNPIRNPQSAIRNDGARA